MTKKLFIKTFGCQMNEYDSQKMAQVLNADTPIEMTTVIEQADIILFNTCSVREKAQEKVFSDLGRANILKKAKPELLIGVGGCVASQEGASIVSRAPYVDVVFGPQTLHRLPALISQRRASGRSQVDISFPEIEKFDHLPAPSVEGATAFVSIMEGCSKYCSFCVVPYTRGEEVSRPVEDVLTEIALLADQGVTEVTLLGQNVNAYQGRFSPTNTLDFAALLELVSQIDGIARIRYSTSHPKEFTQRLIDAYGKLPKLVDHVHLPVQSGSDAVLAAMKRGYTTLEYKSIIKRLRKVRPSILLSSDFIVGFPGETEADFEKTYNLIKDLEFDDSYSFVYSPRPGTPAANLPDDTSDAVKTERLKRLQSLILENAKANSLAMVGTEQEVLIEGFAKKSNLEMSGRASNHRMVNIAIPASRQMEEFRGKIITVVVTEMLAHSLRAQIVPKPI